MSNTQLDQWTILKSVQNDLITIWIEAFLIDRKAQGMKEGTIYFYKKKLNKFLAFCTNNNLKCIDQINPNDIRKYILNLRKMDTMLVVFTHFIGH